MTLIEFAREYVAMRAAQEAYFAARRAGRSGSLELERSRAMEKALDKTADRILSDRTLFDFAPSGEASP